MSKSTIVCPGGGKPGVCFARGGRDRCTICDQAIKAVSDGTIRQHVLPMDLAFAVALTTDIGRLAA